MRNEPCYCGGTDCWSCGPLQGYRVERRRYGLSAEDIDILNDEARADARAAEEEHDDDRA